MTAAVLLLATVGIHLTAGQLLLALAVAAVLGGLAIWWTSQ